MFDLLLIGIGIAIGSIYHTQIKSFRGKVVRATDAAQKAFKD